MTTAHFVWLDSALYLVWLESSGLLLGSLAVFLRSLWWYFVVGVLRRLWEVIYFVFWLLRSIIIEFTLFFFWTKFLSKVNSIILIFLDFFHFFNFLYWLLSILFIVSFDCTSITSFLNPHKPILSPLCPLLLIIPGRIATTSQSPLSFLLNNLKPTCRKPLKLPLPLSLPFLPLPLVLLNSVLPPLYPLFPIIIYILLILDEHHKILYLLFHPSHNFILSLNFTF